LCLLLFGLLRVQGITWTGAGDGRSWSQASNWDEKRVPGVSDAVVIPAGFAPVELAGGDFEIQSLRAPGGFRLNGGTLRLTEGESRIGGTFTLAEGATLEGAGRSVVVVVDGNATEWSGNVRASGGALLRLSSVTRVRGVSMNWRADGPETVIDARSVTSLALETRGWFPMEARNGARVDLSGLTTLRGPLSPKATEDGEIDLSGVRGNWTTEGFTYPAEVEVTDGGRLLMSGLTALDRITLTLDGTGQLETSQWASFIRGTMNLEARELVLSKLVQIDDSTLRLQGGAVLRLPAVTEIKGDEPDWRVEGPGTVIDARSVMNVALGTRGWFPIEVRNQGRVILSGLTALRGPISPKVFSEGEVDLSGVRGRWTTEGFTYVAEPGVTGGGRLLLPGLTALDRVQITLDATSELPMSQWVAFTRSTLNLAGRNVEWVGVTNVDDSTLRLEGGAVLRLPGVTQLRGDDPDWRAEGQGTLIDARWVTNVALGTRGWFPIEMRNQGRVDLSGLGVLRGPVSPKAYSGGELDLSGVRGRWTTEGFTYQAEPEVTGGGRLLLPGLTALDRIEMTVDGASELPMSQWVSFTRSTLHLTNRKVEWLAVTNIDDSTLRLDGGAVLRFPRVTQLRGVEPNWRVDGAGTLIDARSVTNLVLGSRAWFPIEALNQGRVDLSGLVELRGPLSPRAVSGGVIDLSGLKGLWTTEGFTYQAQLYASGEGWIRLPGVVAMDGVRITVEKGGRIDTDQLEVLNNSAVEVDGFGAVLGLGSLRDQTGTTFRILNGGDVVFSSAPRIVTGPVGKRVRPGDDYVLDVVAAGDAPLTYQWYKNGQPLEGEESASLRLNRIQLGDAGSYSVQVANPAGLRSSETALVTLDLPVWPFGDTFARRGLIQAPSGVGIGSNANATEDPGEPLHANKQGGSSVWLTWRAPQTGVATFETIGSNFDTLLAVYRGSTVSILASNPVAADDDGGGYFTSRVVFNAVAGTEYEIAVDGYAGASGDVVLRWTLETTRPALPEILEQPQDALAVAGTTASFTVFAGPADITFQWLKNGTVLPGRTTDTLAIPFVSAADAGTYQVEIRTPAGAVLRSDSATLEVVDRVENNPGLSADKLDDLFLDDAPGGAGRSLLSRGLRAAGGGVGVGLPGGQWTDNSQSTRSSSDPVVCDVATSATRWFRLRLRVPSADGFSLHTEGSEIPAFLAVFTNRTALTLVACDAAVMPQKPAARVTFPARAGVDYLVLVDGVDGAVGRIRLNWVLEDEQIPVRRPEFSFDAGRLVIQMYPLPGLYDWQVGGALTGLQTVFRTNLTVGNFRYMDPDPATAAAKFFWLKPAQP
jgi:hypothetical protein